MAEYIYAETIVFRLVLMQPWLNHQQELKTKVNDDLLFLSKIRLLWLNMFMLKQLFFDSYSMIEIQITQSILRKNYTCFFVDITVESKLTFNTEYGNLISQSHKSALLQNQKKLRLLLSTTLRRCVSSLCQFIQQHSQINYHSSLLKKFNTPY